MTDPNTILKNNPYQAPQFYYPLDLGKTGKEAYVIFDIRDSVAVGAPSKGTIALYMPPDLKTGYRAIYEDTPTGFFGLDTKGLGQKAVQGIDAIRGAFKDAGALKGTIDSVTQAFKNQSGEDWAYALAINESARLQRDFGKVVNPHQAVLFKGMGFRTFNLNFTLIARSAAESDAIKNIIYKFKYHMHPDYPADTGTQRFLLYPENFVIGFYSPSPNYLFQTAPCVLESCDVDEAGSGSVAFFGDTGAPVQINLSLSFKEQEIMTKQKIAEGC